MPADPAAFMQVDVKALRGDGTGLRVMEALVEEQDPLRPLLMESIDRIALAMARGEGAWAYGVIACRGCDLESLAGCMAADFGMSFDLEKPAAVEHGKARLFSSDSDPPVLLGEVGRGLFVLGPEAQACRVVDVIEGRAPSLAYSKAYGELKKSLPAPAAASLFVFDSRAARIRAFGPDNELARALMGFESASLDLRTVEGALEMEGRMVYGSGEGEAARSAELIRKTLAGFASNPILKHFGLALYLEKIKIKKSGRNDLVLYFAASEAEIFELVERKDKIFTLGL
jgi:hypothetical protein